MEFFVPCPDLYFLVFLVSTHEKELITNYPDNSRKIKIKNSQKCWQL